MSSRLSVADVSKSFVGRSKATVLAVDSVSFDVMPNEFVSLVGVSGCGKSSLLSMIAGLETPTDGHIRIDGAEVVGPGRDRGVVFQAYTLLPWLSAQRNVEFALEGLGRREREEVARHHLKLVGLERFADSLPRELSGGMRQRVAIARALAYRPRILLMDEPFGALDALTRQLMQDLLLEIWEQSEVSVIFVTHDVDEAVYLSDRVLLMTPQPGRLAEDISVDLVRPRKADILNDQKFRAIRQRLLDHVRADSM